jgi:hypothetical protein
MGKIALLDAVTYIHFIAPSDLLNFYDTITKFLSFRRNIEMDADHLSNQHQVVNNALIKTDNSQAVTVVLSVASKVPKVYECFYKQGGICQISSSEYNRTPLRCCATPVILYIDIYDLSENLVDMV